MKKVKILIIGIVCFIVLFLILGVIIKSLLGIFQNPDKLMEKNYNDLIAIPDEALSKVDQLAEYFDILSGINSNYDNILKPTGEQAYYELNFATFNSNDTLFRKYLDYRQTGVFEVYQAIAEAEKITPLDNNLSNSAPARAMNASVVSTMYLLRYALLHAYNYAAERNYEGALKMLRSYFIVARVFRVQGMNRYGYKTVAEIENLAIPQSVRAELSNLLQEVANWYENDQSKR